MSYQEPPPYGDPAPYPDGGDQFHDPAPPPTVEFEAPPLPADDPYFDEDDEWVNQAPKGMRIAPLTAILFLVLFVICGFWGGAVLQKHQDKKHVTSQVAAALASAVSRARGGTGTGRSGRTGSGTAGGTGGTSGFGGGGFAGGGASGRTLGTVTDVEGSKLYVTDAQGNLVTIALGPDTKITTTTAGTVNDLVIGSTVIVSGGTGGSATASTITVSPAGSSPFGGGTGGTGATGGTGGTGATGGG